jgi:hypothetical protein
MLVKTSMRWVPAAFSCGLFFQTVNLAVAGETTPPLPYISAGFEVEEPQFAEPTVEAELAPVAAQQRPSVPAQPVDFAAAAAPACQSCPPAVN